MKQYNILFYVFSLILSFYIFSFQSLKFPLKYQQFQTKCFNSKNFNSKLNSKINTQNISLNKSKSISSTVYVIGLSLGFSYLSSFSSIASANIFDSKEQNLINEISNSRGIIFELYDNLRVTDVISPIGTVSKQQLLKGGKEDSNVVLNYLENYIKPMAKSLEEVSKLIDLTNEDDNKRLKLLPQLMKGHILELQQAIQSQSSSDQEREVEEVQDTLNEFLKLAATNQKYHVDVFTPTRPLTEKELLGPFGCDFWGKKRIEGTNTCVDKTPEIATQN